jgi:hypothetical protein
VGFFSLITLLLSPTIGINSCTVLAALPRL